MSKTAVVQYKTRPEAAEENQRLIEEVFAELNSKDPGGLRYMSLRLADGVSFVHVAIVEDGSNPLAESAAFAEFTHNIAERCVEQPRQTTATVVGSYGPDPEGFG
jgi:hypothetical protein